VLWVVGLNLTPVIHSIDVTETSGTLLKLFEAGMPR
jgi:hypothetical protein